MKLIDFNGLQYFYKKIKQMFATLNSSGKVPYKQLPDKVKKVKYIKKERRYFFHKSIPISFFVDDYGNYNPQINGRYDDWYYSVCPVFKITKGRKFRLFFGKPKYVLSDFVEAKLEDLTYWSTILADRINLIEKQGDALICNISNLPPHNIVHICLDFITIHNNNSQLYVILNNANVYGIKNVEYNTDTDIFNIYIVCKNEQHPIPWNKNLKWIGNRIECILPTTAHDVNYHIRFHNKHKYFKLDSRKVLINKLYIRYNRKCITNNYIFSDPIIKIVRRRIKYNAAVDNLIKIKSNYNIISTTHNCYRKQPSKFCIKGYESKRVN